MCATYRQSSESHSEMMSVLSVEARVVYEVDAAADHVARGEGGPVRLPRAGRAERVSIVAMVTV